VWEGPGGGTLKAMFRVVRRGRPRKGKYQDGMESGRKTASSKSMIPRAEGRG